jgi:hypothetical protein
MGTAWVPFVRAECVVRLVWEGVAKTNYCTVKVMTFVVVRVPDVPVTVTV